MRKGKTSEAPILSQPTTKNIRGKIMKNRALNVVVASLITSFSNSLLAAQYVNDMNCSLNEGVTLPELLTLQGEWIAAARANGFEEGYRTAMVFPVYTETFSLPPREFIWRGYFRDGAQMGRLNDFFVTSPEWGSRFAAVMTCRGSSLWVMP